MKQGPYNHFQMLDLEKIVPHTHEKIVPHTHVNVHRLMLNLCKSSFFNNIGYTFHFAQDE